MCNILSSVLQGMTLHSSGRLDSNQRLRASKAREDGLTPLLPEIKNPGISARAAIRSFVMLNYHPIPSRIHKRPNSPYRGC